MTGTTAEDVYAAAHKRTTSRWNLFGTKWWDGAELFEKAGDKFSARRNHVAAAEAYERASHCHTQLREPEMAAQMLTRARDCWMKADATEDAARCTAAAAALFTSTGRFQSAASCEAKLAGWLSDTGRFDDAMSVSLRAAESYDAAHSPQQASRSFKDAAAWHLQRQEYDKALPLLQRALESASEYGVPKLALATVLCTFAAAPAFSMQLAETARLLLLRVQRESGRYLSASTREGRFLSALVAAADAVDPAAVRALAFEIPPSGDPRIDNAAWAAALTRLADAMETDNVDYC